MVVNTTIKKSWTQFWQLERRSFHDVMRIATHHFAAQIAKRFSLNAIHSVFDYGCGPGFLEDYLSKRDVKLFGADINDYFIEECRTNHPNSVFITISTDLSRTKSELNRAFGETKFDFIVVLSIAQYFENTAEFERVITFLNERCKSDGKIIVADIIDENTSTLRDVLGLFSHCVRNGKVIAFLKFVLFVTSSSYAKVHKQTELLRVPESFVRDMCSRNSLAYEKVSGLTIHPSRTNYILSKRP
jgi:2-polyprenyl-3-methyl-5-hydroxy-6-metoxy-1,4-benzoquinol methylase